jgi:hypothetical protein
MIIPCHLLFLITAFSLSWFVHSYLSVSPVSFSYFHSSSLFRGQSNHKFQIFLLPIKNYHIKATLLSLSPTALFFSLGWFSVKTDSSPICSESWELGSICCHFHFQFYLQVTTHMSRSVTSIWELKFWDWFPKKI